ncbi:MAG: hypothetical protein F4018_19695 [Acidobacteria bacterium]|nr:hypothetical protein [Acidobacteriota bacterium]MYH30216.1 hypothetical protein [Acidobacteriota bacterium]MYK90385.1 hypothetical protein [Acidobacteriota bacterium]
MRAMRARRRGLAEREIRLTLPDARSAAVRARVADAVARLDPTNEADALAWIEAVADFDASAAR